MAGEFAGGARWCLVSTPSYYVGNDGSTVWDFEDAFDLSRRRSDAVEYIVRAGRKTPDPREDLRKAVTCIEREIALYERRASQAGGK